MFSPLVFNGRPNPLGFAQQIGLNRLMEQGRFNDLAAGAGEIGAGTVVYQQSSNTIRPPRWIVWRNGNHLWVNIAGTQTIAQWRDDLLGITATPYSPGVAAHWFFLELFQDFILPQLTTAITAVGQSVVHLHLYGHSLGGAVAALAYLHYQAILPQDRLECLTTAQPRVLTAGLTPNTANYCRLRTQGDFVTQLPTADQAPLAVFGNGTHGFPWLWYHYGSGWQTNGLGGIQSFPNVTTVSSVTALIGAPSVSYWHSSGTYWQFAKGYPGVVQLLANSSPNFLNDVDDSLTRPDNDGPALDIPPMSAVDWGKITQANFGVSLPIPPENQRSMQVVTMTPPIPGSDLINPADRLPDFLNPPSFGPSFIGELTVALWKTSLHFRFQKRTFSEVFFCDSTLSVDDVLKFNSSNVGPLLAFRPPGTVLEYIRAVDAVNPRIGKVKYLRASNGETPGSGNRPDVVATGALVTQENAQLRTGQRIVRCWQDDLVQFDANGNASPTTAGAVQGYLDAYLAALNTGPVWGMSAITRKTKNPKNFYKVNLVTRVNSDTVRLTLAPEDFTALNLSPTDRIVALGGTADRNLLGVRGLYYVQSFSTPDVFVQYTMPGGATIYEPRLLVIRKIELSTVQVTKFNFVDWRTRQTSDPIDRVRGRGPKVQTRTGV